MGCHASKLEERIAENLDSGDIMRKEVATPRLLYHKGATVHASMGVNTAALVLTSSQVWFTNVSMPDKTWNIPLERLIGVDFAKYKSGPKNTNSKNKALVLEFNDMDTGMPDMLAIDCRDNKGWSVAICKARDEFRKKVAENQG